MRWQAEVLSNQCHDTRPHLRFVWKSLVQRKSREGSSILETVVLQDAHALVAEDRKLMFMPAICHCLGPKGSRLVEPPAISHGHFLRLPQGKSSYHVLVYRLEFVEVVSEPG